MQAGQKRSPATEQTARPRARKRIMLPFGKRASRAREKSTVLASLLSSHSDFISFLDVFIPPSSRPAGLSLSPLVRFSHEQSVSERLRRESQFAPGAARRAAPRFTRALTHLAALNSRVNSVNSRRRRDAKFRRDRSSSAIFRCDFS